MSDQTLDRRTNDLKIELINKVQAISQTWDANAQSLAIDSVRNPDDESIKFNAARVLAMSDDRGKMSKEVIEQIHSTFSDLMKLKDLTTTKQV